MKNMNFVAGFQNGHAISIRMRKRMSIRKRPGHTGTRRKYIDLKQKVGQNFRSTKVDGSKPPSGIYVYTRPFRIESKGQSPARNCHFERFNGFFIAACHKLEVDINYLARSGVDIIETGWNLSVEKRM
jgi:hypothetical protein